MTQKISPSNMESGTPPEKNSGVPERYFYWRQDVLGNNFESFSTKAESNSGSIKFMLSILFCETNYMNRIRYCAYSLIYTLANLCLLFPDWVFGAIEKPINILFIPARQFIIIMMMLLYSVVSIVLVFIYLIFAIPILTVYTLCRAIYSLCTAPLKNIDVYTEKGTIDAENNKIKKEEEKIKKEEEKRKIEEENRKKEEEKRKKEEEKRKKEFQKRIESRMMTIRYGPVIP